MLGRTVCSFFPEGSFVIGARRIHLCPEDSPLWNEKTLLTDKKFVVVRDPFFGYFHIVEEKSRVD